MARKQMWLLMVAAVLALAVIGAGCRQANPTVESTAEGVETGSAEEGVSEAEEIEMTLGPGDVDVLDPAAGLDELDSYYARLTIEFEGRENGEQREWFRTHTITRANNPLVVMQSVERSDFSSGDALLIAVVGDTVYEVAENGGCISTPLDPENPATRHLASMLPPVFGAQREVEATVNGVDAIHASFDAAALGNPDITDAQGQVWVAENGLVMRYILEINAGPQVFGEDIQGRMSWTYEVTQIGPDVAADLPASCPHGEVDAPIPPDAQNVETSPVTLRFDSATDMAGITAFYTEQLAATGWEVSQEPMVTEVATTLFFRRGELETLIVIEAADQGSHVRVYQRLVIDPQTEMTPGAPAATPTP